MKKIKADGPVARASKTVKKMIMDKLLKEIS